MLRCGILLFIGLSMAVGALPLCIHDRLRHEVHVANISAMLATWLVAAPDPSTRLQHPVPFQIGILGGVVQRLGQGYSCATAPAAPAALLDPVTGTFASCMAFDSTDDPAASAVIATIQEVVSAVQAHFSTAAVPMLGGVPDAASAGPAALCRGPLSAGLSETLATAAAAAPLAAGGGGRWLLPQPAHLALYVTVGGHDAAPAWSTVCVADPPPPPSAAFSSAAPASMVGIPRIARLHVTPRLFSVLPPALQRRVVLHEVLHLMGFTRSLLASPLVDSAAAAAAGSMARKVFLPTSAQATAAAEAFMLCPALPGVELAAADATFASLPPVLGALPSPNFSGSSSPTSHWAMPVWAGELMTAGYGLEAVAAAAVPSRDPHNVSVGLLAPVTTALLADLFQLRAPPSTDGSFLVFAGAGCVFALNASCSDASSLPPWAPVCPLSPRSGSIASDAACTADFLGFGVCLPGSPSDGLFASPCPLLLNTTAAAAASALTICDDGGGNSGGPPSAAANGSQRCLRTTDGPTPQCRRVRCADGIVLETLVFSEGEWRWVACPVDGSAGLAAPLPSSGNASASSSSSTSSSPAAAIVCPPAALLCGSTPAAAAASALFAPSPLVTFDVAFEAGAVLGVAASAATKTVVAALEVFLGLPVGTLRIVAAYPAPLPLLGAAINQTGPVLRLQPATGGLVDADTIAGPFAATLRGGTSDALRALLLTDAFVVPACATTCAATGTLAAAASPDRRQCLCGCRNQWTGPRCDTCAAPFAGPACDRCQPGYVPESYPRCGVQSPVSTVAVCVPPAASIVRPDPIAAVAAAECPLSALAAFRMSVFQCAFSQCQCRGGVFDNATERCNVVVAALCLDLFCALISAECGARAAAALFLLPSPNSSGAATSTAGCRLLNGSPVVGTGTPANATAAASLMLFGGGVVDDGDVLGRAALPARLARQAWCGFDQCMAGPGMGVCAPYADILCGVTTTLPAAAAPLLLHSNAAAVALVVGATVAAVLLVF